MSSYLVIGMGRFGSSIATELYSLGHEVLAVDEDEDTAALIADHVTNVIIGDAKDEAVLQSLGVQNFDCVIVAMAGTIEDSILITLMLKEQGAKQIVCKAQNERHAKVLTLVGADKVVRPEFDMGKRVAHSLAQQNIIDYIELSHDYSIMEIITPSHWVDKSIVKNNLRRKYGITIIAIRGADSDKIKFSPSADVILNQGDILTVIGSKHDLNAVSSVK